jgi:hypothetical protein
MMNKHIWVITLVLLGFTTVFGEYARLSSGNMKHISDRSDEVSYVPANEAVPVPPSSVYRFEVLDSAKFSSLVYPTDFFYYTDGYMHHHGVLVSSIDGVVTSLPTVQLIGGEGVLTRFGVFLVLPSDPSGNIRINLFAFPEAEFLYT